MDNIEIIQQVVRNVHKMKRIVMQYEAAKVVLESGTELEIPTGSITALKQAFATLRTETKDLLDDITA